MSLLGAVLLATSAAAAPTVAATASGESEPEPVVHTDGDFRPGRFETIRVSRFPGAGKTEVIFFPSAICESECGAVGRRSGRTSEDGSGQLRVRVPGYFFDADGRRTPFLNLERIDLTVLWEGSGKDDFAVGRPEHAPVLRRPSPQG